MNLLTKMCASNI